MSTHEPWAVSHRVEYAVRALIELARAHRPLTAQQIAGSEGLPRLYLLAILRDLTTGGILTSRRGRHGGFALARDPSGLSVDEVVAVLDPHGEAPAADGPVPQLWLEAYDAARGVLASVTIADLAAQPVRTGNGEVRKQKRP